ncbi:MAG: sulfotransferase [Shimia sp.]|uniref:sulfotransferase n=1 Tax=Shimia sp. TaxID=1954381 RepID=UPI004059C36B
MSVSETTITLFENQESRVAPIRTFPVFGSPRGGTTAVARVIGAMGVYLGADLPINFEDPQFSRGRAKAIDAISERNETHSIWGWKFPNAVNTLDGYVNSLRNPRFICVTRDLTANAVGIVSRHDKFYDLRAIEHALLNTQRNMAFIARLRRPTLMVSYEKLVMKPEATVAEVAEFLNVELTRTQKDAALRCITPGQY